MVWAEGLPSGRERAIETLIDREPQGAFYRAARVLDEVVPQALVNRPNVVTKGALVEQANALAEHEIVLSNYDSAFGAEGASSSSNNAGVSSSSTTTPSAPSTASGTATSASASTSKDRILRHHAKQCSVLQQQRKKSNKQQQQQQQQQPNATSTTSTPSPQLVAALRQVYGNAADDTPSFNFRTLLKSVMDHKIFEVQPPPSTVSAAVASPLAPEPSTEATQNDEETTTTTTSTPAATASKSATSKEGGNAPVAGVESLIANICRLTDQKDDTPTKNTVIQGLLVAALSVLTQAGSGASPESEADSGENTKKNKGNQQPNNKGSGGGGGNNSNNSKPNKKTTTEDPTASRAVQVGSVLSLLKIQDGDSNNNTATTPLDGFNIDPELIEYFAQAAIAYEGRIEIQKARLLAKLQQDAAVETSPSETDLRTADPISDVTTGGSGESTSIATSVALNPEPGSSTDADTNSAAAAAAGTNSDIATQFADQVAILEGDAANQLERLAEATLTSAAALEQIIASAATGDETSSGVEEEADDDDDEEEEAEISSGSDSGSGSDSDEEMNAGLVASTAEGRADGGEEQETGNGSPATDDEADAQGEDDESSSSSSADDWGMMERRAGGSEVDEIVDDPDDDNDEEDDVLQQALALSLSEHNRTATEDATTGSEAQAGDDQTNNAQPSNESSQTTAAQENYKVTVNADEKNDDSSLPPLPPKPSSYPYASSLERPLEVDTEQTGSSTGEVEPYFDPSVLNKFGSLPTANVLVHLLHYTVASIERNRFAGATANETSCSSTEKYSSVAGGIGVALFPPKQPSVGQKESNHASENARLPVTIQLLVALFLHIMEKRNDAIAGLRKALAHAERRAQGEDVGDETGGDADETGGANTPLSSEEEDDPAIALAMNYAEDDVGESSESLEAKGMIRKAAAAAHDAAALLRLLRRRTEAWKQNVKLYSVAAALALKSLRLFLQSTVRQRLYERESSEKDLSAVIDYGDFLPSLVSSKLSMSLASLMSVSGYSSFAAMLSDDEVGDAFLPLILYKEAVSTWGECAPIVYPSVAAQVEILRNLIAECSSRSSLETLPHFRPVDSLTAMPSSEIEPQVHRLQYLCKRLRVADLLDNLVPHPACYLPDDKSAGVDADADGVINTDTNTKSLSTDPFRASAVVSLLASATKKVCGGKGELQRLFLALCHRYHSRVLLWAGLYDSAESDVDDVAGVVGTQPSVSSGDIVRIGAGPSSKLQFDATKCSDSIAILANHEESPSGASGSSVHQRASKVWGTVLSTHHYNPKTGIHRWAVRLDKCERGHVFVGVATAQASMRTYVGGDKYGWGMIGTQALWHDRRKIRGDYGSTFRTGSTIIVTLDTDAGTLSFSSWKDSSSSSSFSLDPLLQNQPGARRQGHVGGTVEDWGIAFEGLPLDSRLYPAVGLYQRDDRVTLLTVESASRSTGRDGGLEISGGSCYYPLFDAVPGSRSEESIARVRRFNDTLSWEGVQYVLDMFEYILKGLENEKDEMILAVLLPSLSAALCLVPNCVPVISERFALTLLPRVGEFLLKLEAYRAERHTAQKLFRTGLKPGKWIIRATGSSGENSDFEEYVVDFTSAAVNDQGLSVGFEGTGVGTTGKSKNGLVAIFGATKGSSVHFVEEWSDGNDEGFGSSSTPDETSSCVVAARISIDGTKFEGTYRNVQFGTSGKISGTSMLETDNTAFSKIRVKDAPISSKQSAELADGVVMGEAIVCLAYNHMAVIIGEDAAGDQQLCNLVASHITSSEAGENLTLIRRLLAGQLLSGSSQASSEASPAALMSSLCEQYAWKNNFDDPHDCRQLRLLDPEATQKSLSEFAGELQASMLPDDIESKVAAIDSHFCSKFGGVGSLRGLCQDDYDVARRRIICTFVKPCGLSSELTETLQDVSRVEVVWKTALKIIEDGLRDAMASQSPGTSKKEACADRCELYNQISSFLLSLEFWESVTIDDAAREIASLYRIVKRKSDLELFQKEMESTSRRSLLRLVSVQEVGKLFSNVGNAGRETTSFIALESLVIGLPRLLGRSPADASIRIRKVPAGQENGRGISHVDSNSAGATRLARLALLSYVQRLLHLLGQIASTALTRRSQLDSGEMVMAVDSLLLSIVTVFTITLQDENIDEILHGSGIFDTMKTLMAQHRESMGPGNDWRDNDQASVVKKLQQICDRELSRSVLRACVAATHTLVFQASNRKSTGKDFSESISSCHGIVFDELKITMEEAEKLVAKGVDEVISRRRDADWEKFCELSCSSAAIAKKANPHQVGSAGLMYLHENGTIHTYGLTGGSQRPSRQKNSNTGLTSRLPADNLSKFQSGFAFQLLTQWLNILCGILHNPTWKSTPNSSFKWISLLLGAAGLSVREGQDGSITHLSIRKHRDGLLPARFRSRILRFLLPLLESVQPNEIIIAGLLCLAGMGSPSMPGGLDEDEKFVAREAVTLLRQLHSPARGPWREAVNRAISSVPFPSVDGDEEFMQRLGLLSFLSGTMEIIGRGSYVLLKPAAAVPLSIDQQSMPSSKGHSSGVGGTGSGVGVTPHHTVGNGTEGVVAGLCRHEASAGLVSNIDMKNGICEVVLLTRDPTSSEENGESLLLSKPSGSSPRHTLTVRALRTALSDVVHAQEAPLHLDETMTFDKLFGSLIEPALASLFSVMKPAASLGPLGDDMFTAVSDGGSESKGGTGSFDGLRSGLMSVSAAVMLLRSAIVVLSDKRIASTFLENQDSKKILSRILNLAWPADLEKHDVSDYVVKAQRSFLSSLPVHEARYGHLVSILRDLTLRDDAVAEMSSAEWVKRVEGLKARQEAANEEENKDATATSGSSEKPSNVSSSETETGAQQTQSSSSGVAGTSTGGDAETGSRDAESSNRAVSQSTMGSNSEDEEESEAAATAAAHLREAAIAQMAELGLPRSWSELALRRTGGNDIEAAVHFCLERGGEMERLLAEERERERLMQRQTGGAPASRRRGYRSETGSSNHLLRQLLEMGFPSRWCAEALAATGNNVDEALTWILTHGERLSEEDEAMEDEDNGEDIDDEEESIEDEDDDDEDGGGSVSVAEGAGEAVPKSDNEDIVKVSSADGTEPVWSGSVVPLRFISGRSIIDSKTLAISGLPTGGFSSVGTKGILLCSGKWYYEAILETAGCLQIGWADGSFAGHCHADRGDGTGDGPSSWAFDGWRRYRWHSTATEWGCRWKEGDVVGCLVDMDAHTVSFTLNGRGEEIGMGVAFSGEGFRPCGGVYACVSFNRREKLRLRLSEPFKYQPPPGYQGVGVAVMESVKERESLALKEQILDRAATPSRPEPLKRFLCDFSDGEHGHELMAWAHRYYGSDASVHLGSGRSKQSSGVQKAPSALLTESHAAAFTARRVEKVWAKLKSDETSKSVIKSDATHEEVVSMIKNGYTETSKQLDSQLVNESAVLAILFARKFILHLIVTMGQDFDVGCFLVDGANAEGNARQFWGTVEACASLRCAGWVGEAGAMAIAAEALGLGISSNDHGHSRQSTSERAGIASATDLDEGAMLPSGGITQLLSSVMRSEVHSTATDTGNLLAACAEAAIGSDGGGGVLVFLQRGLQSAVQKSEPLRQVLTAAVRRSIRLLAVVEYEGDDSDGADQVEDDADPDRPPAEKKPSTTDSSKEDDHDSYDISALPDARLTSFLTGLLMSKPVEKSVSEEKYLEVVEDLFQAWSVGMLSASLPWRMVCAFTVAGILNKNPRALGPAVVSFPTIARFYGRLESTVARRVWAERAAVPVCSRYVQAMVELLASVKRAVSAQEMPPEFMKFWGNISVDAATPLPLSVHCSSEQSLNACWESDDGWASSDTSWEVWTGTVEYMPVSWETPSRSPVRSLMDGGEGPPMLREGCYVMRGVDWSNNGSGAKESDEDGKKQYEADKAKREKEKRRAEEEGKSAGDAAAGAPQEDGTEGDGQESKSPSDPTAESSSTPPDPVVEPSSNSDPSTPDTKSKPEEAGASSSKKQKKKKIPSPKLPVGTVLSIEPWNGMPGLGRKVRWHLTGKEGVYRYGGDGGRYDISHVEVNEKCTRVKKRHPLPESAEQCAARHGFGASKKYSVILRLQRCNNKSEKEGEGERVGVLEWPDFGAGVLVNCRIHPDGAITITEKQLIYGSKDAGWEARFGHPSFVPGACYVLSPTNASTVAASEVNTKSPYLSFYEELMGSTSHNVTAIRNRADGSIVHVASEMRLLRGRQRDKTSSTSKLGPIEAPMPPPIHFDREYHASSLSLSRDGRTVSCVASDGRGAAYASVGFTKGVHYWEVKLEQADIGSVFIGVAEKPNSSGSGGSYDTPPRLNRWPGWGFANYRATYSSGAERVYGAHCHAGDTVGVLLDCDAGRVSFFFDGLKYGEHILNDLGCAFENLSPFGFNVDGCGSGGAGQGAPSGIEGGRGGRYPAQGSVRPRALWPVIGLRNQGDRVTISPKWTTSYGVDGVTSTRNAMAVDEVLIKYSEIASANTDETKPTQASLPEWFIKEAFREYQRWYSGKWKRTVTRGSGPYRQTSYGLDVDLDSSPLACATASAALGLKRALLAGDRVRLLRSAGRILELAEEAVILGVYQGRLFYQIVSQKSEGGSLTEGGGRAWFLDESEVVDGLPFIGQGAASNIELPVIDRFRCTSPGGLKITYEGGAVVRSDLEIIDGSVNLGVIPVNTVIPREDVLERRVNSCGVTRYRVRAKLGEKKEFKEGWISARIRGGNEEAIVEAAEVIDSPDDATEAQEPEKIDSFPTAQDSALSWKAVFDRTASEPAYKSDNLLALEDINVFKARLANGVFAGHSMVASDSLLASAVSAVSNFSDSGDAVDSSFEEIFSAVKFALDMKKGVMSDSISANPAANQAAAYAFNSITAAMPPIEAIMARVALIRAFNRRARLALPWLSVRPCQEGSAIFGGLCGHGASTERSGRNRLRESQQLWIQIPSVAKRIRSLRQLFFSSVKKGLLQSITEATATPTPLSHDEYELPREIRTVRINRLRSRIAMAGTDNGAKRKYSVFAQLHNETKGWGGAALRRGYVAKGHGGQRRAFKVKLIGEGVNDYSGPYREAFTDALSEVINTDPATSRGSLGVLDPTPNNSADLGEDRDLFMFSLNGRDLTGMKHLAGRKVSTEENRIWQSFSSLTAPRDELSREVEEALVFLGRVTGTAFRHGIPVDLPLPMNSVWRPMVEGESKEDDRLREIDELAYRQKAEEDFSPLLWWQQKMLNSFVEGVSNLLPVEILTLLNGAELRDTVCGKADVDVDLLRSVVEYEGYVEHDTAIQFFWETLRELSNDERKLFLQFVWARNRLPLKKSDFEAPFKIQRDGANSGERADQALPSASTCFFSLALPEYSSKEILKDKLLFAIHNSSTMETDFQTNSAEIAEGYRAF